MKRAVSREWEGERRPSEAPVRASIARRYHKHQQKHGGNACSFPAPTSTSYRQCHRTPEIVPNPRASAETRRARHHIDEGRLVKLSYVLHAPSLSVVGVGGRDAHREAAAVSGSLDAVRDEACRDHFAPRAPHQFLPLNCRLPEISKDLPGSPDAATDLQSNRRAACWSLHYVHTSMCFSCTSEAFVMEDLPSTNARRRKRVR